MLQTIRKNIQGTMAKVIVAIIVVPFALFGIESLFGGGVVKNVAEVNGEPISAADLQQQVNLQRLQLMQSMGENIDPSLLDDQMLEGRALQYLVQKMLLLQEAGSYGLAVSDQRINELVRSMPEFQSDGNFDSQRYRLVLSDQGYTPAGFRKLLRENLLVSQLRSGIGDAEFATPVELTQWVTLREEQRDLRYLRLPIQRFMDDTTVSDSEIEAWYESNQLRYQTEESVDLEYIELKQADFEPELTEAEVREMFELEKDSLVLPELREVSHILFERGEGESEAELQARIAAVASQVETDAGNFADLARDHSQDLGSANFGGELGLTSGDSFPPEIEAVVAELSLNQVSEPVESDSGWHLLLVTDIRGGEIPVFDEVRMQLEQRLRSERARLELVRVVESLRDLVFNAEDLHSPAEQLTLVVQREDRVSRDRDQGLFADPRIISAAFTAELLEQGYNSEVLELDPTHYVVLRVVNHHPARTPPLAQVRYRIVDEVREHRARSNAVAHAEQLLEQLLAGSTIEELALAENFEWQVALGATRDNRQLPPAILEYVFKLQVPGVAFDYVQSDQGDVVLFEIFDVTKGNRKEISSRREMEIKAQLVDGWARLLTGAHDKTLADNAEVTSS